MTRHRLRTEYARVFRDVYVPAGVELTPRLRARAAACYWSGDCVLVGQSAAAMYGTKWLDEKAPAEVVRPHRQHVPDGIVAHRFALAADEVTTVAGLHVTTPARTAFDVGRMLPRRDAIVVLDALCNATDLKPTAISHLAERYAGAREIAALRGILPDVDGGAESPPETDLRLALVGAGLPRPATQVYVLDEGGGFIARCDLGWPEWKVIVEYDGGDHWGRERRASDIERLELIGRFGWTVVRVTDVLLYRRLDVLIDRVTEKLRAAGAPV